MQISEGFWSFVIIAGPIILALAIAFSWARNRARTPREEAQTEAATRRAYDERAAERHRRGE